MEINDALFNFSPVPMWIYDVRDLRILAANNAACKDYGYTLEEFLSLTVESLWPEENKEEMFKMVNEKVKQGLYNQTIVRHQSVGGDLLYVEITSQPFNSWSKNARIIAALDVTDKLHAKRAVKIVDEFDLLERTVLSLNSKKEISTKEVLSTYLEGIENLFPQLACSVMRIRNNRLYNWCSPSLPAPLMNAYEGIKISANTGSCGTAAYLMEKVIVEDIRVDKRWEAYKTIPVEAGFLACSSYPLITSNNDVIATFAVYARNTGEPDQLERMVIERATGLLLIILENRLINDMLADTHKLMEQGQELAQFGNWSWDMADNVVTWSDTLYSIYGLDNTTFNRTFEGYQERLHPEDRARVIGIVSQLQKDKIDVEFEERIIRPNGEIRHLRTWGSIKCDEEGNPNKMIGACLDISEWKKAGRKLQLSNDRYEYISKASKDAVYDMDFTTNHINWGDGFSRVFGYSVEQENFSLEDWTKLLHPEDIIEQYTDLQRSIKDPNSAYWTGQYRLLHKNGNYLFVEETGYILRDSKGVATQMIGVIKDITERHEAEKALIASEKRYSDLFHLCPLPMWVYDIETYRFLDVNAAAIRIYGYSEQEFLEMTIMDIRPIEDIQPLKEELHNNIKSAGLHSSISRHLKKNGELLLVNVVGNGIGDKRHNARLVIAIDNTEKIQAQEALEQSERRFKQLIQEGSDLIAILNEEGNFKYVSPTAERVLGIKVEDLIGQNSFGFVHPDDLNKVQLGFEALQDEKRVELPPFRIFDHEQNILWLETIVTDMRDDEAISGIITNARDVTHRIISDIQNMETLERYNIVAKATSDTIWDYNLITEELVWNHGIQKVFGYTNPGKIYPWWKAHVHPDDLQKIVDIVNANKKSGDARWSSEYRFRCADDTYKTVFDRGFLIFDEDGIPIRMIGAMQDITERTNYIREIEQHNSKLKDIAWTQTHMVRGPLSRIMGITSLLKTDNNDQETMKTLLEYLEISAVELDDMIKSVIKTSTHT